MTEVIFEHLNISNLTIFQKIPSRFTTKLLIENFLYLFQFKMGIVQFKMGVVQFKMGVVQFKMNSHFELNYSHFDLEKV